MFYFTKLTNKEDGYTKEMMINKNHTVLARIERDPEVFQRVTIVFLPIIRMKNCFPVPLDVILTSGDRVCKERILPQKLINVYNLRASEGIKICARVSGYTMSQEVALINNQMKDVGILNINVIDEDSNTGLINIHRVLSCNNHFTYYFYSPAVLINETPLDIVPFYIKDKKSSKAPLAVGGTRPFGEETVNTKIFLLNSVETNIKLTIAQGYLDQHFSGEKNVKTETLIPVKAIDSSIYPIKVSKTGSEKNSRLFELGLSFTSLSVDMIEDIYTKVIQISPRNILINCTDTPISIK